MDFIINALLIAAAVVILVGIACAIGIKLLNGELSNVGHWKDVFKYYSTWLIGVIGASPQLWNEAIAAGIFSADSVPGEFSFVTWGLAAYLFFANRVKQINGPPKPVFGPSH